MSDELVHAATLEELQPVREGKVVNIVMDSQLLSSMMTCPRKADFRFNRNLVKNTGKSNALECGSYVHTILEFYHRALMAGKSKSDAIAIGFDAGKEYVHGYKETNKYVTDPKEEGIRNTPLSDSDAANAYQTSIEQATRSMEEYFQHYINDAWTIIGVEEVRGNLIYEAEDIRVIWKAKYDMIVDTNAGIHSVDHKTYKQKKDTAVLNNQFIGQCELLKSRSIIINKIGFQKTVKPVEKFTRPVISYSLDLIEEWKNDIIPYYARMWAAYCEAGHFPPNYQSCQGMYGMCEFYEDICRVDRGMREESLKIFFKIGPKWDVNNNDD